MKKKEIEIRKACLVDGMSHEFGFHRVQNEMRRRCRRGRKVSHKTMRKRWASARVYIDLLYSRYIVTPSSNCDDFMHALRKDTRRSHGSWL